MSQVVTRGDEPSMYLQRPSTGKSQDVRHILAKTFRELYTRDAIGPDTVKNLSVSKGGDDPYHEKYVEALQKVFDERQRRMEEAAMLERHIMQAQARAMSADERELNRTAQSCDNYPELGLPPGKSNFRSCIDTQLLHKHKLLTPADYATEEKAPSPPPLGPKVPSYARDTMTSRLHLREEDLEEDNQIPPFQRSKSEQWFGSVVVEDPDGDDADTQNQDKLFKSRLHRNEAWKHQLSEDQREQERISLMNLQAMVEYKRNPRHIPPSAPAGGRTLIKSQKIRAKEVGIRVKPQPLPEPKEPSVVFLVSPPIVVFSSYKVGQVYELTLTLKNISACIRQCRALPPSTPYFSIGLGQFPGEHGLVASGMSCRYAVRFAPDSLRDFDDEIKIQTQSTNPIIVPLQGRRPPPKLTLPSVVDVGHCLVGGCHVTQLVVKNEGGLGKFCIMPSSAWPTTNFKSVVRNGSVSAPPFEVRPSVLELGKNESGLIEIAFSPNSVKVYSVDVTLVCDNCQVKHFTLKGEAQKAGVELMSVERGTTEPVPGELNDATAKHLIKFDSLNPFTYTDRVAMVRNTTNVSLPFQWMIYKPQFDTAEDDGMEGRRSDRVPDVDSVFSVHPPSGVLPPTETMEFKITFAPPMVDSFHSSLHLLLNMVPPSMERGSSGTDKSPDSGDSPADDDDNLSEILLQHSDLAPFGDVTALELEVKGESTPLNVVLHPYAVHIPGKSLVGTTLKKMVTMANHSRSTITFQWEPFNDSHILEVEPPFGELDPGMAMDMELSVTGPEPGRIDHTLYCHVMNMDEPLTLQCQAEFKGPEIIIEEPDVNFGLVRLGQVVTKEITLTNMSQIITQWSIQDSPAFASSEDDMALSEFSFEPTGGELKPLEVKKVTVTFNPQSVKSVRRVLEVSVEEGQDCNIACFAEVQVPQVCLVACEVTIDNCYKGVPVMATATLLNQTLLPTIFEWGSVQGDDANDCSVELEPSYGALGAREEKTIRIHFTAFREGEFAELRVPCRIEGMEKPIVMALFCDVNGLSVEYSVSTDGQNAQEYPDDVRLDFGQCVPLGSAQRLFLHIRNHTAITAQYTINAQNYFSKPPSPPDQSREGRGVSQRRVMLSKTPNLADPLSKTTTKAQADLCEAMLCQGQGAAIVPSPAVGYLVPFGEEVIEVTAFSDIWGQYTDNLLCKVGDLEVTKIPISMNVVGCPLSFQMTAGQPDVQPILRFGSHVAGTAVCNRKMRVKNSSPYDIRVDWDVFNVMENDNKLLDLVVYFGKAFPLRDAEGKEIVPPKEVPAPVVRQPTDFIPNSEDTTPTTSREVTEAMVTIDDDRQAEEEREELPSRPKVVSVVCRPHEGQKSTFPYSIKPSQLTIPAKGHASITVSFTPMPTGEVSEDKDCQGYALGYMSLDGPKSRDTEGKVTRVQGFDMTHLRLDMTALLKPALLTLECAEEEGMRYRSAMSNLLQDNGQLLPESLQTCSVMLSNLTMTPLTFRLLTKKPFTMIDLDPSSNKEGASRANATDMHTLKPRHNLIVKVAFQTTTRLLSEISDEYMNPSEDESCETDNGKKLDIKDNLVVEFNNNAKQLVPLHATLTVPQFNLSKTSLDFGTCLVGQTRELQFLISNQTSSHTYWSISQECKSDSCATDTFRLEPDQGFLEAHITYVSDSKSLLRLYFTAKHAEEYTAVFTFHGILGEMPRRLSVRGQGSYDGKHEAILNV